METVRNATNMLILNKSVYYIFLDLSQTGLVSSVRRALAAMLRGPGFKSRPGTVGGLVTIIMWGARPGW